jgi:prepilin-type N-terminal cleavage/methylation domain-containing protein
MQPLTTKLLLRLSTGKQNGFTLIELLVVVIIVGVLAAIALPNMLAQVGKAREAELKNAIGTINRAQQAYHWEFQIFADGADALPKLRVNLNPQYIDAVTIASADPKLADPASATVTLTNNEAVPDGTRSFSGGTYYSGGKYSTIVCATNQAAVTAPVPTVLAFGFDCPAGTTSVIK